MTLGRVGDAEHGDLMPFGPVGERLEHGAHVGDAMAVDLAAHVGRDRVDDDERHVADLFELKQQLVGTWTLVSSDQVRPDGSKLKQFPVPEPPVASEATLGADEEHILRCLGAALIMRWNTLQTELQRELFDAAGSIGGLLDNATLRAQIARFLRKHANGHDEMGRSSVQS
jgi:hypothetical protein